MSQTHTELLDRQKTLEGEGLEAGVKAFRKRVEDANTHGRGADAGAARKLVQMALEPLADGLAQIVEQSRLQRGQKHQAIRWIQMLGPDVLAFITVRTVLDSLAINPQIAAVAKTISTRLVDELRFQRLRTEQKELFDYRMEHFNTSSYVHRQRSLMAALRQADVTIDDLDMPDNVKVSVGVKLIDTLIATTQMVRVERRIQAGGGKSKPRKEVLLVPEAETLKWIDTRNGLLEMMEPVCLPMVVPPSPWIEGHTRGGGYRFALRFTQPMVRGVSKSQVERLQDTNMPVVYDALNAIQATPWKINADVLALVEQIVAQGGGLAGIPSLNPEPMPAKPADIETNEDSRKVWRKLAHQAKERNVVRRLAALTFDKKLTVARKMKDDPAIYFPCSLDFRGRVYSIAHYLNPQGDDLCKGLLTFSEGHAVGESGAVALAIHGANALGTAPDGSKLSKGTLAERVEWVAANTAALESVAHAPLDNRWWLDADEPWQFFAFCCEWAEYAKLHRLGRGHEYVSSLPCAQDGTCNGLQHFAALLLDTIGGAAVNVVPNARPADVYQRVADAVLRVLELGAVDSPVFRAWLSSGCVTRKLTKRPTMTFSYGSKKYGFKNQLLKYMKELDEYKTTIAPHFEGVGLHAACKDMSALIWDALQEVVVSAAQGMAWMQSCAKLLAKDGKCVEWVVPGTGFPVKQTYMQATEGRVNTVLLGQAFRPKLYHVTDLPNVAKQANAVSPNVIHSLDAAALMLTVERCRKAGVTAFGMIHDSYATHAAFSDVLAKETREAFISLYTENDVLESLAQQWWTLSPNVTKWPELPAKGSLDLTCVRESLYFFS